MEPGDTLCVDCDADDRDAEDAGDHDLLPDLPVRRPSPRDNPMRRWTWTGAPSLGAPAQSGSTSDVERLSDEFSRVIRDWLEPWELSEVRKRNRVFARQGLSYYATHEFCDANQAMSDALLTVLGRDYVGDDDNDLVNAARALSKAREFYP